MTYLIKTQSGWFDIQTSNGEVISECRWKGYSTCDLLFTCMVWGYGFELRK